MLPYRISDIRGKGSTAVFCFFRRQNTEGIVTDIRKMLNKLNRYKGFGLRINSIASLAAASCFPFRWIVFWHVGPSHIGSKDQYNNNKIRHKDVPKGEIFLRIQPFGLDQEKGTTLGVDCSSDLIKWKRFEHSRSTRQIERSWKQLDFGTSTS